MAAVYICKDYSGEITPDHIECDIVEYLDPLDLSENVTEFVKIIANRYRKKQLEQETVKQALLSLNAIAAAFMSKIVSKKRNP